MDILKFKRDQCDANNNRNIVYNIFKVSFAENGAMDWLG